MIHESINIGREANKFINKINRHISNSVAEYGITGPQAHMLNFIYDHSMKSDVMQKDIEKEFNIRRSTTTNALQIMEKQGLITRTGVSTDARIKKVSLTKNGKEVQQIVSDNIHDSEIALRDALTKEEFEILILVIIKLSGIFENELASKGFNQE